MSLPRLSLLLSGIGFLALGAYFLLFPDGLFQLFNVTSPPNHMLVEIGAMYGGLEIGLGVAFLVCSSQARWVRSALAVQISVFGGLAAGRLFGMMSRGITGRMFVGFLLVELAGMVLGIVAFRRARQMMIQSNLH